MTSSAMKKHVADEGMKESGGVALRIGVAGVCIWLAARIKRGG